MLSHFMPLRAEDLDLLPSSLFMASEEEYS